METTRTHQERATKTRARELENEADKMAHAAKQDIEKRVEQVREIVDDIRDRAEMAFHEKPYLLPIATGAVGLGVGILIGSKLSRVLFLTAAGAMLSETVRERLVNISKDFVRDLDGSRSRGEQGEEIEDVEENDYAEPSVT